MTVLALVLNGDAMARFEVITGPERRRRWSEDQKRAIVAESLAPGAVISEVARRADYVCWTDLSLASGIARVADGFAQVLLAPPESAAADSGVVGRAASRR